MSCKHPLKGWHIGYNDSGTNKYKITSFNVKYVYKSLQFPDSPWMESFDDLSPEMARNLAYDVQSVYIEIPCGHCISCRLKYSRDWANRCMLEAQEHDHNYFITLTYDNEHLPPALECVAPETGEIEVSPVHSLVKRDFQLFMKRLRKHYSDQKIRFFGCGEYGAESMRPHFHIIAFGLEIDDLVPKFKNEIGNQFYVSETIEKIWGKGFAPVGECTWETCAYTARYVTKKLSGEGKAIYERYNYTPEFSLCSRKPGIARNYYDRHKASIYRTDELIVSRGLDKSLRSKPPKYFDKLFDFEYPEEYNELREKRKAIAEENAKLKSSLTSLSYLEQLQVEEDNLIRRTEVLKRNQI